MIKNLATECRMPFCYGGGVTTVEEAKKIISLGAEKVALSTTALLNFTMLKNIGIEVGVQSVVVVIDLRKRSFFAGGGYDIYYNNGKTKAAIELKDFIEKLNEIGVGEIVINSIDQDGTMIGYDFELISLIREMTDVPITALGGAGSLNDVKKLIQKFKIIGAGAGSLFIFKGKYRAVLISYPNREEKVKLFKEL